MALERATITWINEGDRPADTYYFLSPNGEEWLEVTAESYHRAVDNEPATVRQLQNQLDGKDGTMRIRMTRRYMQMQGQIPGRSVAFN